MAPMEPSPSDAPPGTTAEIPHSENDSPMPDFSQPAPTGPAFVAPATPQHAPPVEPAVSAPATTNRNRAPLELYRPRTADVEPPAAPVSGDKILHEPTLEFPPPAVLTPRQTLEPASRSELPLHELHAPASSAATVAEPAQPLTPRRVGELALP